VGNQRRRFGVARRKKKASCRGEGGSVKVCSIARFAREKEKKGKGMVTAALRMAGGEVAAGKRSGAPWRARERTAGRHGFSSSTNLL
jgi:hypothetical protein